METPIAAIRSGEDASFADLIRARENQQLRIRSALEQQNVQLRGRLAAKAEAAALYEQQQQQLQLQQQQQLAQPGFGKGDSPTPQRGGPAGRRYRLHRSTSQGSSSAAVQPLPAPSVQQPTLQPPAEPTVSVTEFITFVTELKTLVNHYYEADCSMLSAIQDKVELQQKQFGIRTTELESQIIAVSRAQATAAANAIAAATAAATTAATAAVTSEVAALVAREVNALYKEKEREREREERTPTKTQQQQQQQQPGSESNVAGTSNTTASPESVISPEQQLHFLKDIEGIRTDCNEALRRVRELEGHNNVTGATVNALEQEINAMEQRLVDAEVIPAAFRREAASMEERYQSFSNTIRTMIEEQQTPKAIEAQVSIWEEKTKKLENAVLSIHGRVESAYGEVQQLIQHAEEAVQAQEVSQVARTAQFTQQLNEKNSQLMDELRDSCAKLNQMEQERSAQAMEENIIQMNMTLEEVTQDFQRTSELRVQEKISEIERWADEFEEERRKKIPPVDEERIDHMTKELESAAALLEGAIARTINRENTDSFVLPLGEDETDEEIMEVVRNQASEALVARLQCLETQVVALEGATRHPDAPVKMLFSIDTQTGEVEVQEPQRPAPPAIKAAAAAIGASQQQADRYTRNLNVQLQVATAQQGAIALTQAAHAVMASASDEQLPGPLVYLNGNGYSAAGDDLEGVDQIQLRAQTSISDRGPYRAPKLAVTSNSIVNAISQLRQLKAQKENAVARVLQALRVVQIKFQEISNKEPTNRNYHSGNAEEIRRVAALIAKQKEEIYYKERQLVDTRNRLWREIAQLEEDEREILSQQHP